MSNNNIEKNVDFYYACYRGNLPEVQKLSEDSSILESIVRAKHYLQTACLKGHIDISNWLIQYPTVQNCWIDKYLLVDVCRLTNNKQMAEWIYLHFRDQVDITLDDHYLFRTMSEYIDGNEIIL